MLGFDFIEKLIVGKVASYGLNVVMGALAETPVGMALEFMKKASEFVEFGESEELGMLARAKLGNLKFKFEGKELINKAIEKFSEAMDEQLHPAAGEHLANWQYNNWAMSREDWLANRWRHDWRSQPRNRIGEWTPGRLPYPQVGSTAIGKGKVKTSRRRRRLARYRRYGRIAAKSFQER